MIRPNLFLLFLIALSLGISCSKENGCPPSDSLQFFDIYGSEIGSCGEVDDQWSYTIDPDDCFDKLDELVDQEALDALHDQFTPKGISVGGQNINLPEVSAYPNPLTKTGDLAVSISGGRDNLFITFYIVDDNDKLVESFSQEGASYNIKVDLPDVSETTYYRIYYVVHDIVNLNAYYGYGDIVQMPYEYPEIIYRQEELSCW